MSISLVVGDIGGTKVRLACAQVNGSHVVLLSEQTFVSADYASFDLILAEYLASFPDISVVSLGVAGPVQGGIVKTTNLPWVINAYELEQKFNLLRCVLLNDLEAVAYGLPALDKSDLCILQLGTEQAQGNQAVIAAGTGLGEAGLFWDGHRHNPFATEGGHASFSASDEQEMGLLKYLQQRYGHVSWERIVSGMGIRDIHQFLRLHHEVATPTWLAEEIQQGDMAAVIAQAALDKKDAVCVETMSMFVRLYAAEAGNLALKIMCRGGLYIGGGIAPKILPLLQSRDFLEAFLFKGRMSSLLASVPVKVILNDRVALFGPALLAAHCLVEE